MSLPSLDSSYWNNRYSDGNTGWDLGAPSTPLKTYFDQLENKEMKILIPGCGHAWEAEYLHQLGFSNVYIIDLAPQAIKTFLNRVSDFPEKHVIQGDFFHLEEQFDMIVEQTFFCAINPSLRSAYVKKACNLLHEKGRLVGLLFDFEFGNNHPPFGGSKREYVELFQEWFFIKHFDTAYNSITPRAGKELFVNLRKR